MRFNKTIMALSVLSLSMVLLTACFKPEDPAKHHEAASTSTSEHGRIDKQAGFQEVNGYQIRLGAIQKGPATHLDVYIHDTQERPISQASVTVIIATPEGKKISVPLQETPEMFHYEGQANLDDTKTYQAVVETTINGKKYAPKFTFSPIPSYE